MTTGTQLAALLLIITSAVGAGDAAADGLDRHTTPQFVQRAEIALAEGNLERAVGLVAPRVERLRGEYARNRAYATLCNAHLRQQDYDLAGEACTIAADSRYASWSDYNNLGAYHYLTGDLAAARESFERASEMAPGEKAVGLNRQAILAATTR
ncbi:MAG TPA: hypothetical protein VJ883_04855 [Woeseiaceae bacterium]|nr:hypothetical protein [Woeseiaceae bacterium]